jgi:group I intron endonuclease
MEYTIYKIYCKDENIKDCYIGSTKNLSKRIIQHKINCNNSNLVYKYNLKIYTFIRNNGGFDNFDFEIVEVLMCKDKNEALNRERYWIETLKASLNTIKPTFDYENMCNYRQKWRNENKEYISSYNSNRERNYKEEYEKDKFRLLTKITCECGATFAYGGRLRHYQTKKHLTYLSCHQEQDEGHTDIVALEV